ncbi:MAG: Bifunctional protein FolD [Patescibacteria group bacterium]|nr:Bifunctional protein FolD [Patescibacteria group bacterium]
MKILNGRELAEFIKERQAKQVRGLRQAESVAPKLAIIVTIDHPAIDTYVRMKQKYGNEIGIGVELHRVSQGKVPSLITSLNADPSVNGIIVQLPLEDPAQTNELCNMVTPEKDVDALGVHAMLDPATPTAILWLLAGYNVDLQGKKIVLVGRGKLVGAPLERILRASGHDVEVVDRSTERPEDVIPQADILITATGVPSLITSSMIKPNAVVVDAGIAGESGTTVGDLAADVRERIDLTITPVKGGVGPLTICALFDNVIRAARQSIQ